MSLLKTVKSGLVSINRLCVRVKSELELDDFLTKLSKSSIEAMDLVSNSTVKFLMSSSSLSLGLSFNGEGVLNILFDVIKDSEKGVSKVGAGLLWDSDSDLGKNVKDLFVSMSNTVLEWVESSEV